MAEILNFNVQDIYIYEKEDWTVGASINMPEDENIALIVIKAYTKKTIEQIMNWDMSKPIKTINYIKNTKFVK